MKTKRYIRIFLVLYLCVSFSCYNREAIQANLMHQWIIEKAFRNEKITESLSGLYFDFQRGGELATNLNGADERLKWVLQGEDVLALEGQEKVFLHIASLSDSTLVLDTKLQGYNFRFQLRRKI